MEERAFRCLPAGQCVLLLLLALPGLSQRGRVRADRVPIDLPTHKQSDAHRALGHVRSIMPGTDRRSDPAPPDLPPFRERDPLSRIEAIS